MALHESDQWYGEPPLPPELMDEPIEQSAAERALSEAFQFSDEAEVDISAAVEMIADGDEHGWRIVDDDGAEWALRKIAGAERELAELQRRADAWAAKIAAWFQQAAREPARTAEFFTAHVEWFARQQRELGRKSVVLPSGKVATRTTAACADVGDEAALIGWVEADGNRTPIAPPQPRKVLVRALRDQTSVVEVIDRARLVLASGELIEWEPHVEGERCPKQGDGWPTPETATDLVAMVQVIESHPVIVDKHGEPVPGAVVRPEHVTVTVSAS
jgi:hypothetical protein